MSQPVNHYRPANVIRAMKWLRRGGVDPELGLAWRGERTGLEPLRGTLPVPVWAVGTAGLPYDVDEELWVVDLFDVAGTSPFPEQRAHGGTEVFHERERRVLGLSGRLVGRVDAWTEDLAREFAVACGLRLRERAIHSMRDADELLGAAMAPMDLASSDGDPSKRDAGALGAELSTLQNAEYLLAMWREARVAETNGPFRAADAYAAAAAGSRVTGVLAYAAAGGIGGPDSSGGEGGRKADLSFADERRWQAEWLRTRLGLEDLELRVRPGRGRRSRRGRSRERRRGALTA